MALTPQAISSGREGLSRLDHIEQFRDVPSQQVCQRSRGIDAKSLLVAGVEGFHCGQ